MISAVSAKIFCCGKMSMAATKQSNVSLLCLTVKGNIYHHYIDLTFKVHLRVRLSLNISALSAFEQDLI